MIALKKFKKFKQVLEKNIEKKSFRSRLLIEAIYDEKFADEILNYIQMLKLNISAKELDELFANIRQKTIDEYEKAQKTNNIRKQLDFSLRSLAYYYFLECMDEYSTISDSVIEDIHRKYNENYLKVISEADRVYLSLDMKEKMNSSNKLETIEDDLILKYLVLKKWQDKQHYFFEGKYWQDIEKVHKNYIGENNFTPFELEQKALINRMIEQVTKNKFIDLETCSLLSELYIKQQVIDMIGGKMYGLAVLNSNEIPVPYSIVIPTCSDVTCEDINFLNEKFDSYSVRSSADIEDGEKNSFAGMFESFLNVNPEMVLEKVQEVKKSIYSDRVSEYIKINKLPEPHMAVVVQPFKEPTYAGVWIGNSENSGILEYVDGNGEKLVSGQRTPYSESWNGDKKPEKSLEVNGVPVGEKMLEYQKLTKCNSDFEWMILDGNLVMLQFRPVTKNVIREETIKREEGNIYGIAAAPGKISGKPRFLETPKETLNMGEILLTKVTGTSWVPNLMKAKGAITARGGALCHTAIICREIGIPCITGVGDEALHKLANAKSININGNTGEIVIEKEKCNQKEEMDEI